MPNNAHPTTTGSLGLHRARSRSLSNRLFLVAAQVAQSLCNAPARLPASWIRPGRPSGCASLLLPGATALSCLGDTAGAIRADRKPSCLQNSDWAENPAAWRRKPPRPSLACDESVFRRERGESPRMAGLRVRIGRPTRLRQDVSRYVCACARPVPAPRPARIPGVNQPWVTRRRQPRSLHCAAPRQTRPPQSSRCYPCRPPRRAGPGLVAALRPAAGNLAEPERYDDMLHGYRYDRKPDFETPRPRAAVCAGPGRRGRKARIWRANRKVGILRKGVLAATAAASAAFMAIADGGLSPAQEQDDNEPLPRGPMWESPPDTGSSLSHGDG